MPVGQKFTDPPIPPVEANTRWFEAGPLTFGVEHRLFNEQILRDVYGDTFSSHDVADDSGVSLHVRATADRTEYLRFDCFEHEPHYHYIVAAEGHQVRVPYDRVADGPMLDWALDRLRTRLGPMLREAGAGSLADQCDDRVVANALDQVEATAHTVGTDAVPG